MKMPIFGKNCLKSAKSSHAVPTEHTFTGLPAISDGNCNWAFLLDELGKTRQGETAR